jgi:hypothetical protein
MHFNKRQESASIANWQTSHRPLKAIEQSNKPRENIWATSAYNSVKPETSPIGCWPKKGQVVRTPASITSIASIASIAIFDLLSWWLSLQTLHGIRRIFNVKRALEQFKFAF